MVLSSQSKQEYAGNRDGIKDLFIYYIRGQLEIYVQNNIEERRDSVIAEKFRSQEEKKKITARVV